MAQVNINSISGRLEGVYKKSENAKAPCVLLLHPHPLYDGNMYSKIIFLLEKIFFRNGFSTLKFNFRGVGNSEGVYGEGKEEIVDASICYDWLQENNLDSKIFWVAGFSFGAYIAIQMMMRRVEISRFIALGTPANMFDISFIYPCPVDGLFVHAEKDIIAPLKEAERVIKKAVRTKDKTIEYELIKNADHFFTNHLDELEVILENYIQKEIKKFNI